MLNSLGIKNFRNLSDLEIKSLGTVNLITGRNNTGKSTILEAIALYVSGGSPNMIYELLAERGENYGVNRGSNDEIITESNLKSLAALFTNRKISFEAKNSIIIGEIGENGSSTFLAEEKKLSLRLVRYFDKIEEEGDEQKLTRIFLEDRIIKNDTQFDYDIGLEIKLGNLFGKLLSLNKGRFYRSSFIGFSKIKLEFIRSRNIDKTTNVILWDNITLSDKELNVVEALKIIEPRIERIAFVEGARGGKGRSAIVKLKNSKESFPLRSMGDGIISLLIIILALVNAENGYLLIDEFENGLHYSVQEKLWEMIFKLSKELNVQVFATTHSEDCIISFESVLNKPENKVEGQMIRLDNVDGVIKQVAFDKDELRIATEHNIETR